MQTELVGFHYSPWTERARWVLDHHRVPYVFREHLLLFQDPFIERRARRLGFEGEVTLPALFRGQQVWIDSFEIAKAVDAEGKAQGGEPLIPEGALAEVRHFNLLGETLCNAGRALLIDRIRKDPEAQAAALPRFVPGFMRPLLRPIAGVAMDYLDREFQISEKSLVDYGQHALQCLIGLRAQLQRNGGAYLLEDRLTLADVIAATSLQMIHPVSNEFVRLGSVTRRAWTHPELSQTFDDLVRWRDELYRKHRRPRAGS